MRKVRVLFVCVGNSCRSQMAEGFARTYGQDVIQAFSAGLAPAAFISTDTHKVMVEKNIRLTDQFPKGLDVVRPSMVDLVVNMSGYPLPPDDWEGVREWSIRDPIGQKEKVYREVRDEIENKVMGLILELRTRQQAASPLSPPPRLGRRKPI